MIRKTSCKRIAGFAALCLCFMTQAAPAYATDWEHEYVIVLGHAHHMVSSVVLRDGPAHNGRHLPRSSFYSHDFLRARLSMYSIDHGHDDSTLIGYAFHAHSDALPYFAPDNKHEGVIAMPTVPETVTETPIDEIDPETRVSHWSVY